VNRPAGLANYVDGGGGTSGWKHSEETKARISARGKGRKQTEAMRQALRRTNENKVFSEQTRAKMREAAKRRSPRAHSQETRAKIAASHKGIRPTPDALRKMSLSKMGKRAGRESPTYDHAIRTFRHQSLGEFIGTRADFIAAFSLSHSCVSSMINGHRKSVKGWHCFSKSDAGENSSSPDN
jgi:hypothetical protein